MKKEDFLTSAYNVVQKVAGHDYRYMTFDGSVYGRPFWDRFHHRAEFKATALTTAAFLVTAELVFKGGALPALEFIAGSAYGYAAGRSDNAFIDYMFEPLLRHVGLSTQDVIDRKPDPGMETSPKNMLRAQTELQLRHEKLPGAAARSAFNGAFAAGLYTLFNGYVAGGENPEPVLQLVAGAGTIMCGVSLAFACETLSRAISSIKRMEPILSREHVVLSEPPAKQERLVDEPLSFAKPMPSAT